MTSWEKDELTLALSMRIAFIETGDPLLRAVDVHAWLRAHASTHHETSLSAEAERKRLTSKLKPLDSAQMKHILQLEALRDKIQKAKVTDA